VFVYEPRKLPRVLSPEEVLRLLEAAPGPKHKAALSAPQPSPADCLLSLANRRYRPNPSIRTNLWPGWPTC
jgi:hypothetical protein